MTDFTAKNIKKWEVDQTTLGKILGLTPRWVRQLTADNVIKSNGRGKYSVAASVQAYVAWIKAAQQRAPPSDAKEASARSRARSLSFRMTSGSIVSSTPRNASPFSMRSSAPIARNWMGCRRVSRATWMIGNRSHLWSTPLAIVSATSSNNERQNYVQMVQLRFQ